VGTHGRDIPGARQGDRRVMQVADAKRTRPAYVAAAERASPWARRLQERSIIIRRWYDLMLEHADELACC
jgi:acyl-CoA reductase-like NAD-dependent aldehyde dehydrogenase